MKCHKSAVHRLVNGPNRFTSISKISNFFRYFSIFCFKETRQLKLNEVSWSRIIFMSISTLSKNSPIVKNLHKWVQTLELLQVRIFPFTRKKIEIPNKIRRWGKMDGHKKILLTIIKTNKQNKDSNVLRKIRKSFIWTYFHVFLLLFRKNRLNLRNILSFYVCVSKKKPLGIATERLKLR